MTLLPDGEPASFPPAPRWDRPLRIGPYELPSRFNLAPLAGYTNLPFRLTVRELGYLGLATTDLVNARAILEGSKKSLELLATCADDVPLAVQIFGAQADELARAAQWLEQRGTRIVDINMGCPVRKVVKTGGGSALMCDPDGTVRMIEQVVRSVHIPITVKMRLGWDTANRTSPYFARAFEQVGVAAVTIHGRTREQGFSGTVDLDGIREVVETVERIPVIGNGDVRTIADAERMFRETGCAAIAIGRGALANPWIFRQLGRWVESGDPGPCGTYFERIDFMQRHFQRLVDWRGERMACLQFRKIATWYTRALRAGKEIQQILVMLDSAQTLRRVADRLRAQGPPSHWAELDTDANIAVPSGPIAHW